jgi:hypothetical protein
MGQSPAACLTTQSVSATDKLLQSFHLPDENLSRGSFGCIADRTVSRDTVQYILVENGHQNHSRTIQTVKSIHPYDCILKCLRIHEKVINVYM